MRKSGLVLTLLMLVALLAFTAPVPPDIKITTTTKLEFKGSLGTMMRLFGANKPLTSVDYFHGNMKRIDNLDDKGRVKQSTIIDLDRELIINVDHEDKSYTQMTFAEWREMIKTGLAGLTSQPQQREQNPNEEKAPEVNISFTPEIKPTGEKENIAGYPAEKVIMTLKLEAETKPEENRKEQNEPARGGLTVRTDYWLAKSVRGYDEIQAFNKNMLEKMGTADLGSGLSQIFENVMKNNPELGEAMKKLEEESKNLDGVPLRTSSIFETWAEQPNANMQTPEEEKKELPKSVGGLFKGFGKKLAKKDKEDEDKPRVLLESHNEISAIEYTDLAADLFAVPANYKLKESKKK